MHQLNRRLSLPDLRLSFLDLAAQRLVQGYSPEDRRSLRPTFPRGCHLPSGRLQQFGDIRRFS